MQTTSRPMTVRERKELAGYVSGVAFATRALLFAGVMFLVGAALRLTQQGIARLVGVANAWPLWLLPTIGLGAWLYRRSGGWTGGRGLRARIRADLARGEVAEHHVVVVEAIEAEEVEDEGPVFFVRDQDGERLYFCGQFLAPLKRKGFPWTAFRIVETPDSRRFLHIRSEGPRFPTVYVRAPFPFERKKALGMFEHSFGRLEVDLEEVKRVP